MPLEFAAGSVAPVGRERIARERGYVYYLAADGFVWRTPTPRNPQGTVARVSSEPIAYEPGFTYYVDADGRVARGRLAYRGPVRPELAWLEHGERLVRRRVADPEIVGDRVDRERGFVYFVGADGFVWRVRAEAGLPTAARSRANARSVPREPGYVYFVNRHGMVARARPPAPRGPPRASVATPSAARPPWAVFERVGAERIARERGYLYFLGKDGYVWRTPLRSNPSGTKLRVSRTPVAIAPGYIYRLGPEGYVVRTRGWGPLAPSAGAVRVPGRPPAPASSRGVPPVPVAFCPRCGWRTVPGGAFCSRCGLDLRGPPR